jgi:hypothetical protein
MDKGKRAGAGNDNESESAVGKEGGGGRGGGNGRGKSKAKPARGGDKEATTPMPGPLKPSIIRTGRFDDAEPHSLSGDTDEEKEEGREEVAGALSGGGAAATAAAATHEGKKREGRDESAMEISDDLAFLMSLGEVEGQEEGIGGGVEDEDDDLALLARTRGDSEGSMEGGSEDEDS